MTREGVKDRSGYKCKHLNSNIDPHGMAYCSSCGEQFEYDAYRELNLEWDGPRLELRCPRCGAR